MSYLNRIKAGIFILTLGVALVAISVKSLGDHIQKEEASSNDMEHSDDENPDGQSEKSSSGYGDYADIEAKMPLAQKRFIDLVCNAMDTEVMALNELKKYEISKNLESNLAKLLKKSKEIFRWIGIMGLVKVDQKGQASIIINMPQMEKYSECLLMLSNVEETGLFNKKYFTTISHGDLLFKQISNIDYGDQFTFSGNFVVDKHGVPRHDGLNAFFIRITTIESPVTQHPIPSKTDDDR